jgi:general secretion pathway protein I
MAVSPLKNKKSNQQKSPGFTLIEVLIAMAVLGIALLAITRVVGISIKDNTYINTKNLADWVAIDISAKVRSGIIDINAQGNTQNGIKQIFNTAFPWELTIIKLGDVHMQKVTIVVYDSTRKDTK